MDDTSRSPHRILGIDPGLNITGYGVIDTKNRKATVVEAGIIRTTSKASLERRLVELFDGLLEILELHQPAQLAIEELYSHYERPRTAILMGHARGVLVMAAAARSMAVNHYAATQVKRVLTGSGRAPKDQVQWAVTRELSLQQPPDPPDVADALAIALCHFHLSKSESILT